jgi:hypothetical protein
VSSNCGQKLLQHDSIGKSSPLSISINGHGFYTSGPQWALGGLAWGKSPTTALCLFGSLMGEGH